MMAGTSRRDIKTCRARAVVILLLMILGESIPSKVPPPLPGPHQGVERSVPLLLPSLPVSTEVR